jgi:hypothetical protein
MTVDKSISRIEQGDVYRILHAPLMRQTVRHVGDSDKVEDVREQLYFHLQAAGCPQSPASPTVDESTPCEPFPWHTTEGEMFFQDGGDDDSYY